MTLRDELQHPRADVRLLAKKKARVREALAGERRTTSPVAGEMLPNRETAARSPVNPYWVNMP